MSRVSRRTFLVQTAATSLFLANRVHAASAQAPDARLGSDRTAFDAAFDRIGSSGDEVRYAPRSTPATLTVRFEKDIAAFIELDFSDKPQIGVDADAISTSFLPADAVRVTGGYGPETRRDRSTFTPALFQSQRLAGDTGRSGNIVRLEEYDHGNPALVVRSSIAMETFDVIDVSVTSTYPALGAPVEQWLAAFGDVPKDQLLYTLDPAPFGGNMVFFYSPPQGSGPMPVTAADIAFDPAVPVGDAADVEGCFLGVGSTVSATFLLPATSTGPTQLRIRFWDQGAESSPVAAIVYLDGDEARADVERLILLRMNAMGH